MTSTLSAVTTSAPIMYTQSSLDPNVYANAILGRIDTYSSLFLGICGIILVIMGFFIWNHLQQKKEANEQLREISKIYEDTTKLYAQFTQIMDEAKSILQNSNSVLQKLSDDAKGASALLAKTEKKSGRITELATKMKQMGDNIEESLRVMKRTSKYVPSGSSYSSMGASGSSIGWAGGAGNQYSVFDPSSYSNNITYAQAGPVPAYWSPTDNSINGTQGNLPHSPSTSSERSKPRGR